VRSPTDLDKAFAQITERWNKLDILFVNAGIQSTTRCNEVLINETMDINFKGALFMVQKAVPLMPKQQYCLQHID